MKLITFAFILALLGATAARAQTETSVTFPSGELTLSGTWLQPDGCSSCPVVVFVHGSGPNDRDETLPLVDPNSQCLYPGLYGDTSRTFRDLARDLSARGIASLRYDKRSFTFGAQLNPETTTVYDFIADAVAAVQFAAAQGGVDPERVIVIGHSQGANFLPSIARQAQVAALVSMAGAARGIDSILGEQIQYIYTTCADSAQGAAVAAQLRDAFQGVRAGTWPDNAPIAGAYPLFWKDWIGITDSTVIEFQENTLPTLFLQGTEDINVRRENGERFRDALAGTDDVWFLPGLTHQFCTLNNVAVSAVVADTIAYWLATNAGISGVGYESAYNARIQVHSGPGYISVQATADAPHIEGVELYDSTGKLVAARNATEAAAVRLATTGLARGGYICRVLVADGNHVDRPVAVQ